LVGAAIFAATAVANKSMASVAQLGKLDMLFSFSACELVTRGRATFVDGPARLVGLG
jgi:hypothetical protein